MREPLEPMHVIVAVDGGQIIGMGAMDSATIKRMSVRPQRRGEGVGKAIYQRLEERARTQRLPALSLDASMNAIGFYEQLGFSRGDELSWRLAGATLRNLTMTKPLS
jgi:putative acetyltransferase